MMMACARIRLLIAAIAIIAAAAVAAPVWAQQPTNVDPNAAAVHEQQLLQQFKRVQGLGSIPDTKSYVIEQPQGREWREFHEVWLPAVGTIAMLGMIVLLGVFFLVRGMIRIRAGRSGVNIVRFNAVERFVHWLTAACFILLALTGLNITFGKVALLPLIGPDAFSSWSLAAKYAHNFLSFPFTIGVILMFFMWIAGNIPTAVDVKWLAAGGGFVGESEPPAYRFNGGQKILYWIVVVGGAAMAITGYILMFPFYGTTIADMQLAEMVHGIVAVLFVSVMIAHTYIGTIGMEGAFEAMGSGTVDLNWAKEHHSLWVEEENAQAGAGGMRGQPSATPAE